MIDQDILDVVKYNQEQQKNLNSVIKQQEKVLSTAIQDSKELLEENHKALDHSLKLLKKYGINIHPNSIKTKIDKVLKTKDPNAPIQLKDWTNIVKDARDNGYKNITIESILTPRELEEADEEYLNIKSEFGKKTKLDKLDITFLFLAIALQCARQYLLSNEKFRFNSASEADMFVKEPLKKHLSKEWQEILLGPVPYDAVARLDNTGDSTGLSGNTHRYRTLGHDPILGWIFGPINILSDSLTKTDFITTYKVTDGLIGDLYIGGTIGSIQTAFQVATENKFNLPAAVIKQAIHFGSDIFTKQGLPIPFISSINNDFSQLLIQKYNIDMYSVSRGVTISTFINSIISIIHSFFYDEKKHDSLEQYRVKTQKILLLSNIIASSSNIIYVSLTQDYKKFDLGGLLVTVYRLISDVNFIQKVQSEYILNNFDINFKPELDFLDAELKRLNDSI
jgi:hypothetical protein